MSLLQVHDGCSKERDRFDQGQARVIAFVGAREGCTLSDLRGHLGVNAETFEQALAYYTRLNGGVLRVEGDIVSVLSEDAVVKPTLGLSRPLTPSLLPLAHTRSDSSTREGKDKGSMKKCKACPVRGRQTQNATMAQGVLCPACYQPFNQWRHKQGRKGRSPDITTEVIEWIGDLRGEATIIGEPGVRHGQLVEVGETLSPNSAQVSGSLELSKAIQTVKALRTSLGQGEMSEALTVILETVESELAASETIRRIRAILPS